MSGSARTEVSSRADPQLREHLAQVVLDGARADEQLAADLRVGVPLRGEPGDLRLLCGEHVARLDGAFARRLAGGEQLAAGSLGERFGPDPIEHLVGDSKLVARVETSVLASQPLAVHEASAGLVHDDPGVSEPLDRLEVVGFGAGAGAEQGA